MVNVEGSGHSNDKKHILLLRSSSIYLFRRLGSAITRDWYMFIKKFSLLELKIQSIIEIIS